MKMDIDLLIHYVTNETSAEEKIRVEDWCKQNSSNQTELDNLQLIWNLSYTAPSPASTEGEKSLLRFKEKADAYKKQVIVPIRKSYSINDWIKVAAVFVGIPLMIWFFTVQIHTKGNDELTASTRGKTDTTLLADGSMVILNKNSILKYPRSFSGSTRTVHLDKGEAFFKVSHDSKSPFFVFANGIRVKVVGTAFNVKVRNGQTEIIVESGKVSVNRNQEQILLTPSESVLIGTGDQHLQKQKQTDLLYNYYRSKQFIANGTPLWKLAAVLEEAYDVNISFQTTDIKDLPMSTTFRDESLDDILNVIARTFNLKVSKNGNRILFKVAD